jgi:hypothetical protein
MVWAVSIFSFPICTHRTPAPTDSLQTQDIVAKGSLTPARQQFPWDSRWVPYSTPALLYSWILQYLPGTAALFPRVLLIPLTPSAADVLKVQSHTGCSAVTGESQHCVSSCNLNVKLTQVYIIPMLLRPQWFKRMLSKIAFYIVFYLKPLFSPWDSNMSSRQICEMDIMLCIRNWNPPPKYPRITVILIT